MSVRVLVAVLIFMMVQGFFFGVGAILVLATPLAGLAMQLMPWVIGVSLVISAPVAWMIAPRMMVERKVRAGRRPAVAGQSGARG